MFRSGIWDLFRSRMRLRRRLVRGLRLRPGEVVSGLNVRYRDEVRWEGRGGENTIR